MAVKLIQVLLGNVVLIGSPNGIVVASMTMTLRPTARLMDTNVAVQNLIAMVVLFLLPWHSLVSALLARITSPVQWDARARLMGPVRMVTQIVVMASAIRGKCVAQVKMNVVLLASGQAAALPIDVPVRNPLDTIPIQVHYLILVVAMELVILLPNIVAVSTVLCVRRSKYVARLVMPRIIHVKKTPMEMTCRFAREKRVVVGNKAHMTPHPSIAVVFLQMVSQYVKLLTIHPVK